jgi:hypothetical protein
MMDYDAKLPFYYKNNYEFFSRYLPHVKHKKDNGLLEKSKIRWFSYGELKKEKKNFRSFYQNIVDLILKKEKDITETIFRKEAKHQTKNKTKKHGERKSKTRKNKRAR